MRRFVVLLMILMLVALAMAPAQRAEARTEECAQAAWAHWHSMGMNTACIMSLIFDMFGGDWGADADGLSG